MAIKIIDDEPDIVLTRSQHDSLLREWEQNNSFTVAPVPFEHFVRQRLHNIAMQERVLNPYQSRL